MKIKRLTLKNVTSYKESTTFDFELGLNIVIGPNGGGKSNLQRILAMVLSHYFIRQHDFVETDDESDVKVVDLWNKKQLKRKLEPFLGEEDADQEIEIVLSPDPADLENIRTIAGKLDQFNEHLDFWDSPVEVYEPGDFIEALSDADSFTYRIHNLKFEEPEAGSPAWAFKEYLRTFLMFMRLSNRIPDVKLTSPVFFFFSERAPNRNARVQTNQFAEATYYSGYRNAHQAASGDSTDLLQWGAQHFARLYHRAVYESSRSDAKGADIFAQEPDVQLLNHYLGELGYEWDFWTDQDRVSFTFFLTRRGSDLRLTTDRFSSGEREIVHFLLAMFALNVEDGVVLVDEPELHLHPRWQKTFLGLFRDLAPKRNNQFLIATHSPVFVTPDTVDNITRVYKTENGSAKVGLRDVDLPAKKSLVRMINSQNNERVFFADKAVLVEGISDRLVLASLLDGAGVFFKNNEAIEIIEVGGKGNFADYTALLAGLETPSFVLADLDYLREVGSDGVAALFAPDDKKAWNRLRAKKGTDAESFVSLLRRAIDENDAECLKDFLAYVQGRSQRLVDPVPDDLDALLATELGVLAAGGCYVLGRGEIEDYLPPGVASVKDIVDMTTNRNWINEVEDPERRLELGRIVCGILEVAEDDQADFERLLVDGGVAFPEPLTVVA